MTDPRFKATIPVATVITGDVHYSIEQASTGRHYDGKAFVDVSAGAVPPTFPIPEGRFVGYRRIDVPIPPDVFTPDVYVCIYLCKVDGSFVGIGAELWDLRDPAQFPVNVRLDDWFYLIDEGQTKGTFKHVKGPQ